MQSATLAEHKARDATRTECEEIEFERHGARYAYHSCPICPHGLIKGYEVRLTGDEKTDGFLRGMKQATIEASTCRSDHPELCG
jgi:hypothetical protein